MSALVAAGHVHFPRGELHEVDDPGLTACGNELRRAPSGSAPAIPTPQLWRGLGNSPDYNRTGNPMTQPEARNYNQKLDATTTEWLLHKNGPYYN